METKGVIMSKYFLIFSLIGCLLHPVVAQDTSSVVIQEPVQQNYPGKPLIMSLVLPGLGQAYNGSSKLKISSFLGVEFGSILAWYSFTKKADKLRSDYQDYADQHWSLDAWVNNRNNPTSTVYNGKSWTSFSSLNTLIGTHSLTLILSGSLMDEYGQYPDSDSLEYHPEWITSGELDVVKDHHFYENVGKYNQFVGGWDDARNEWYWEEKDVGDSLEIIIKTPKKENYLDQRVVANRALNFAKYSITALLFNHVVSGLEAVWTNQKNAAKNIREEEISSDVSLLFNPQSPMAVGGVSLTINF